MRFFLGENKSSDTEELFKGLWEHMPEDVRTTMKDKDYRYLLVEDFETTGLKGDPEDVYGTQIAGNDFYCFLRAEGISGKTGLNHGNWGVGKYTFLNLSGINTVFVYTVRENDSEPGGKGPLVMGTSSLKTHELDGTHYTPDGFWADFHLVNDKQAYYPFNKGSDEVEKVRSLFNLSRDTKKSGLSIAVPHIPDDLTKEELLRSIIRNYGLPIIWHSLIVEVADAAGVTLITPESIKELLVEYFNDEETEELSAYMDIATWRQNLSDDQVIEIRQHPKGKQPKWSTEGLISEEVAAKINEKISNSENFLVRVPINIEPHKIDKAKQYNLKKGESTTGMMEIAYAPLPELGSRAPQYYRRGLRVSEVAARSNPTGHYALITVNEPNLVRFLGDAEGISHTQWSAKSTSFRGEYKQGQYWLSYVKNAPSEILRVLRHDNEVDTELAKQFFAISPPNATGTKPPKPPKPRSPKKKKLCEILVHMVPGGFKVMLSQEGEMPEKSDNEIRIRTAYDVFKGAPKHNEADFDLDRKSMEAKRVIKGGEIKTVSTDEIVAKIGDREKFELTQTGFDPNRDVIIYEGWKS